MGSPSRRKAMAWQSSATFILYLLYYLLPAVSGQLESDGCLSLSSSQACRAFGQNYISLSPALTSAYPFLSNITDVQSFDDAMYAHVAGASVLQQLGCNNTQNKAYYPRYSLSKTCASLVHDASGSTNCNYNRNIDPQPLCQSTCNTWVDSLQNMTSTNAMCPSALYSELRDECSWPAFLGVNGSCVLGTANEPDDCGFRDDQAHACEYCESNSDDACCQSLSCDSSSLSAGAIAGIVVGAIAAVGLLLFALYFMFFRRRSDNARFLPITTHADNASGPGREDDEAREHLVYNGTMGTVPTIGITAAPASVEMDEKTQLPSPNPVEMAELFCEVVHSYPPQEEDELDIREGDIVYLIFQLDDGWGYGLNVATSQMGVFPLVCVMRAREELLEQLLLAPKEQDQFANDKTLAEDEDHMLPTERNGKSAIQLEKSPTSVSNSSLLAHRMQQIRDDVRRSISVTSLRRISRQPRAAPPVQVHHHDTMPTKRVTDALSPQQPLFSAPPSTRLHHYADSIPSPRLPPPPPPQHRSADETFEMHHPNPSLQ